MLKFYFYSIMLFLFITNCSRNPNKEKAALNKSDPAGVYGVQVDLEAVISIDQLLTHSDLYIDKEVLIEGKISAVCPMRGCWIDVKSAETDSELRLKVTDGEIVFPLSGKGQNIKAEGIFQKLDFHRIVVLTHVDNAESIKGLSNAGFQREGTLRDYLLYKNGERFDVIIFSILKNEFSDKTQ